MYFEKCLALLFSLLILGQAYLVRRYVGTWLFPACLFGLFWFGLTFMPLVVLLALPIDPWGTGYILLCLAAFSFTAFFFPWSEAFKANALKQQEKPPVYGSPFLMKMFNLLSFATLACILIDFLAQGLSLHDLIFNLISSSAAYRDMVTYGYLNITIYERLSEIMVYDVAILGGLLISSAITKWGRFRIILFSFAPGALFAVAKSTKWAVFSSVAFFYAGLLAHRVSQGDFRLFKKGALKRLTLALGALLVITTVSFMSRGLQDSEDTDLIQSRMQLLFASYSCAHLYGFSDWLTFYLAENYGTRYHSPITYSREHTTFGLYTFAPVFRVLGGRKVLAEAMPDDEYEFGDILVGNIYTMFRGLIQDFGLLGSLLFMSAMGFLIHWAYYRMLLDRNPVLPVAVFVFSIDFFYASFGRSLFSWSGIYFTFVLLWIVLYINRLIAQKHSHLLAMPRTASEAATQA